MRAKFRKLLQNKLEKARIPLWVHFDLTFKCNLKCIHCLIVEESRKELSLSEIKCILDELADIGCLISHFSGGEVFLRDDFIEILQYARYKGFASVIFSNGTLIDTKIAKILKKNSVLRVQISLYGGTSDVHDKITGISNSFYRSIEAIKFLKEEHIDVSIACSIMKDNYTHLNKLIKLCRSLRVSFAISPVLSCKINKDRMPLSKMIGKDELFEIYSNPIILKDMKRRDVRKESFHNMGMDSLQEFKCGAGSVIAYISPYGDVLPCLLIKDKPWNLKEHNFYEIWNHSSDFLKIRSMRIEDLTYCKGCGLLKFCQICPGNTMLEEGSFFNRSAAACLNAEVRKEVYSKL